MDTRLTGSHRCTAGTSQPHEDLRKECGWQAQAFKDELLTVYLNFVQRVEFVALEDPELNNISGYGKKSSGPLRGSECSQVPRKKTCKNRTRSKYFFPMTLSGACNPQLSSWMHLCLKNSAPRRKQSQLVRRCRAYAGPSCWLHLLEGL